MKELEVVKHNGMEGNEAHAGLPIPVHGMEELIRSRKDLVVKIGNTYEISRPLALELWKMLVEEVRRHGGELREEVKVEYASREMVIVSVSVGIRVGNGEVVFVEIGEAYSDEKGKETTLARTAFTRAIKRVLERIAGEDFINKVVLSLFKEDPKEVPASERQKELIKKLAGEKKLTKEVIEALKSEGVLAEDFQLKTGLDSLTYSQANAIISRALGK